MNVYWLEQTEADVPADNRWLSVNEAGCLEALRFPKRRADWRLGRWTAKCAISAYLDLPAHVQALKKIEIRAASSGAPEAYVGDHPSWVTISISHREGTAICAVAMFGVELGCDVEMIEPRSNAFLADYFTGEEQELLARASSSDGPRLSTLLWSAKESTLKALRMGLRLDTRSVIVGPLVESVAINGWSPLSICHVGERPAGSQYFHGWWQRADNTVRTFVANWLPDPPIRMPAPAYLSDIPSACA